MTVAVYLAHEWRYCARSVPIPMVPVRSCNVVALREKTLRSGTSNHPVSSKQKDSARNCTQGLAKQHSVQRAAVQEPDGCSHFFSAYVMSSAYIKEQLLSVACRRLRYLQLGPILFAVAFVLFAHVQSKRMAAYLIDTVACPVKVLHRWTAGSKPPVKPPVKDWCKVRSDAQPPAVCKECTEILYSALLIVTIYRHLPG